MLRLDRVNKYYRVGTHSLHVLRDIDFQVDDGEFVAIMGSSGSGKSTLLNILGILDEYDSGLYKLGDTTIKNLSESKAAHYRNKLIGFVFQSFNLLPFKTAVENVALPLYYQGISRRKRNQIAMTYLERVGLRDWAGHLPSEMSGGQKQRVAIARALIGKPRLILADEPTGALDSETSTQIMDLLTEIHQTGITLLVVTHDPEVAARCERIIRLKDGKVVGQDEPAISSPGMPAKEPTTATLEPIQPAEPIAKVIVEAQPPTAPPTRRSPTVPPPPPRSKSTTAPPAAPLVPPEKELEVTRTLREALQELKKPVDEDDSN